MMRGVSASKEDVHNAIKNIDKGIFPQAFCKIIPDILGGDPEYCNIMHADGAGTKSSLAYMYWKETGDLSVWKGIAQVRPGARLGDIGNAVQQHAESAGFSVVREFCGHGIGARFHEDPQVVHYGEPGTGVALRPNMIFTIEPMINAGKAAIRTLADGWTVVTKDHSLSAQWEHTVLVTDSGYEVLTVSGGMRQPPEWIK